MGWDGESDDDDGGPRVIVTEEVKFAWYPVCLATGGLRWLKPVFERRALSKVYDFMSPYVRRVSLYYVPEDVVEMKLKGDWYGGNI